MMRPLDSQLDRHWATRRCGVALLLGLLAACPLWPAELAAQEQAWEFSRYKVQIWLATETAGELDDSVRQSLVAALSRRIQAVIGAPWAAEIVDPPAGLRSSMLIDAELITPEILDTVAPESLKNDKIILLTVHVNPREFQIEARVLDCRTRLFGAPVRRISRQPHLLDIACFEAVADSFRAVTRLEVGEPKTATVRIRAGGLVLDRSSPCYVGADDILLPIQRNNDRAGLPKQVIPIEWTFLQVQSIDETNPYLMTCRVWSGKPNPVTGRNTGRKERYALKVKPTAATTTLRVMSRPVKRDDEPYPMAGLEVYAKEPEPDPPPMTEPEPPAAAAAPSDDAAAGATEPAESPAEPEAAPATPAKPAAPKVQGDPAELLGRTEWDGSLEVGQSETLLRILYLKNGNQLLARLPMVPGLEPMLIASVPDDAPRLQAEGFIKGLQGQLMDLEAQREILKARFMMRIEEGKPDEAQELLEDIKRLPTRNDLVRQLDVQQNQQIPSPIASVQSKIDQLYAKMREALGKYLSPNLVNELTQILNNARRTQPATATTAPAARTR